MNFKRIIGFAIAGVLAASVNVSANEVISTASKSKGGQLALDFLNSGGTTAFEFEVVLPKGAKVDTGKCVSELPSSHTAACRFNEKSGRVVVIVYSAGNALLPKGVVSLGMLSGSGLEKASIQNLLVSNVEGESLAVTSKAQAVAE